MNKKVAIDRHWVVLSEVFPLCVSVQFCYKLRKTLLWVRFLGVNLSQRFVYRKFLKETFRSNTCLGSRIGQKES